MHAVHTRGEGDRGVLLTTADNGLAADELSHSQPSEGILCEAVVDVCYGNRTHPRRRQVHPDSGPWHISRAGIQSLRKYPLGQSCQPNSDVLQTSSLYSMLRAPDRWVLAAHASMSQQREVQQRTIMPGIKQATNTIGSC